MRKQRVVEPPERAEGCRGSYVRVIALGFQRLGRGVRIRPGKITLVRHSTDNEKPPRVGTELSPRSCGEDVTQVRPVDIGVAGVAPSDVKLENIARILPHRQDQLQLVLSVPTKVRLFEVLRDRFPAPENFS